MKRKVITLEFDRNEYRDIKSGLWAWYPFKSGTLLAIGNEADYPLEVFERCELSVFFCAEIDELANDNTYDYVIFTEKNIHTGMSIKDFLYRIKKYLKREGVLIFALSNSYGLSQFCGECKGTADLPFGAFLNINTERHVERAGMEETLIDIGFDYYRFFYPLPNHEMPQVIYSDNYLPKCDINERLLLYHDNKDTLIADELALYPDIIKNNVFPFFANSFIVECSCTDNLSKVNYVTLSSDRGHNKALATVIYNDKARKVTLFKEGISYLYTVYKQMELMRSQGIPMIDQIWEGSAISMPLIKNATLSVYLRDVSIKADEFVAIIDKLWLQITGSGPKVSAEENVLLKEYPGQYDWGPILKKAYIEMIPLNCFYDGKELLFFDQEYVYEDYPAKYIMYRAIYYLYAFAPSIGNIISIEKLKERYGLTELWYVFETEEELFQQRVRLREKYNYIYQHLGVSQQEIILNIKRFKDAKNLRRRYFFENINNKKIFIFGSGYYFSRYMEEYSEEFEPALILDNNESLWGAMKSGIAIENPNNLTQYPTDDYRLIICAKDAYDIERQLKKMGILDYRIYTL